MCLPSAQLARVARAKQLTQTLRAIRASEREQKLKVGLSAHCRVDMMITASVSMFYPYGCERYSVHAWRHLSYCMQKLHYALIRNEFRKAGAALTIQNFFRETIRSELLTA